MAPSFLRFQTEELRIWTIQRNTKSDEKYSSILQMENRFRSAGIGESGIVIHLYLNVWNLVKHNRSIPEGGELRTFNYGKNCDA
jgi:hypothetical protein